MSLHVGIDLTSSEKKPSALAAIDDNLHVLVLQKIPKDEDIIGQINSLSPATIGIDSPLSLPLGWHCLEAGHNCQPPSTLRGRECERVMAKMGIPSYFVTTHCIIRDMVYRGIELKRRVEANGHHVLEVYPYGSKVQLWGKPIPRKTTPKGLAFLREKLTQMLPKSGIPDVYLDHDLCDALIAAYTAYLYSLGKSIAVGDVEEGLVILPSKTPF